MTASSKSTRLRQLVKVFLKYDVLKNITRQTHPEKVRQAFEELGPTFIKVGQILSVRSDLLSLSFTRELKKLQDQVKQNSFTEIETILKEELKRPLQEIFTVFEETPFASASIGQAHRAILTTGEEVVVKIQHPGIAEAIELDLSLFAKALPLLHYVPESNVLDLKSVLQEIRSSLHKELDFQQEARNAEQFYQLNNGWKEIRVPLIYPDLTTKKVLVMELMAGASLRQLIAQKNEESAGTVSAKEQKRLVSGLLIEHFMKQVFEDGYFHADPHPGNVLLQLLTEEENQQPAEDSHLWQGQLGKLPYELSYTTEVPLQPFRLNIIDFGMMGSITHDMQVKLSSALIALYSKDTQRICNAVLALCNQTGPYSEEDFLAELELFLKKYLNLPVKEIDLQKVFAQVIVICHNNNLQINRSVTMLIKAFGTLEGVIEDLNPDLSLFEVVAPFAQKYFLKQFQWQDSLKESGIDLWYALKNLPRLPSRAADALDTFTRGRSKVTIEIKNQERFLDRVENMVNRLVIGLILAALVIGSSLLIKLGTENSWITTLGIIGYAAAVLLIVILSIDIFYRYWKNRK